MTQTRLQQYRIGTELKALLSLARPVNALIAFTGIIAAGLIAGADLEMLPRLLLAAAAGMLLGSSGNVINDIFDVEIDRINKPGRAIPSGGTSKSSAALYAIVLAVLGIVLSLIVGIPAMLIATGCMILLYLYSSILKTVPLLGNLIVGVLTGTAFIYGGVVVGNPVAGVVPALFAFFYNIGREILKDIEDMEGDKKSGIRTFPLLFGVETSLVVATVVFVIVLAGTMVPFFTGLYNMWYLLLVFTCVDVILLYVLFSMWRSPTTHNIARLCRVLKYDMLAGIAAIYVGTF